MIIMIIITVIMVIFFPVRVVRCWHRLPNPKCARML